jgi:hypothetical protein
MSIEFFRPESQRPLDADGFELPPWLNPYFAIPEDAQVVPSEADVAWLNEHPLSGGAPDGPTDADWEEYHQWSQWQDRLEAMHYIAGDQAAADAGLPVG